jgi:methionine-rich copper-binding protein CopC
MIKLGAAMTLALAAVLFTRGEADAHAAFIFADPAPDSVVTVLREYLTIVFSQEVSRSASGVILTAPDGSQVSGELTVEGNRVYLPIIWSGFGQYLVEWWNVSLEDGHEASGSFTFTLAEG